MVLEDNGNKDVVHHTRRGQSPRLDGSQTTGRRTSSYPVQPLQLPTPPQQESDEEGNGNDEEVEEEGVDDELSHLINAALDETNEDEQFADVLNGALRDGGTGTGERLVNAEKWIDHMADLQQQHPDQLPSPAFSCSANNSIYGGYDSDEEISEEE